MVKIQVWNNTVTIFNPKDNQQETLKFKGSSETTCKGTILKYDDNFLNWFIGFTEGVGSFAIPTNKAPQFEITLNIQNINVLYKIKKFLGFGSVKKFIKDNENRSVFQVIGKDKHLIILALIFNGKLKCPNNEILFREWYSKLKNQNKYIFPEYIFIKNKVILTDGWLSGFTDAKGCFKARLKDCTTCKLEKNLLFSYSLLNIKTAAILENIKECLNLTNKIYYNKYLDGYEIFTENLAKQKVLMSYFKKYPLKTNKKIEFLRWYNLYNNKFYKLHLSEEEILKIIKKKLKKFKI